MFRTFGVVRGPVCPTFVNEFVLLVVVAVVVVADSVRCYFRMLMLVLEQEDTGHARCKSPSRSWVPSRRLETSCKNNDGEWTFCQLQQPPRRETGV